MRTNEKDLIEWCKKRGIIPTYLNDYELVDPKTNEVVKLPDQFVENCMRDGILNEKDI